MENSITPELNGNDWIAKMIKENNHRAKQYTVEQIVRASQEYFDGLVKAYDYETAENIWHCNSTVSIPAAVLDSLDEQKLPIGS